MMKLKTALVLLCLSVSGWAQIPSYMTNNVIQHPQVDGLYKIDARMSLDLWAAVFNTNIYRMAKMPKEWAAFPVVEFTGGISGGTNTGNGVIKFETGTTVSNPDLTVRWNKYINSSEVITITGPSYTTNLFSRQTSQTNAPYTAAVSHTTSFSTSRTYVATIFDSINSNTASRVYSFDNYAYYGASSSSNLTSSGVKALSGKRWYDSNTELQATIGTSVSTPYAYFCYPATNVVDLVFYVNGLKNTAWTRSTVVVSNGKGQNVNYSVWKFAYPQSGAIQVLAYSQAQGFSGQQTLFVYTGAYGGAVTPQGGVEIGTFADTGLSQGVAIGEGAVAQASGAAVGLWSSAGGYGGAVGNQASADNGGAVGYLSTTTGGGSVGRETLSVSGFSGGYQAKSIGNAVQLGTGSNGVDNTIQFMSNGSISATTWNNLALTNFVFRSGSNVSNAAVFRANIGAVSSDGGIVTNAVLRGNTSVSNLTGTATNMVLRGTTSVSNLTVTGTTVSLPSTATVGGIVPARSDGNNVTNVANWWTKLNIEASGALSVDEGSGLYRNGPELYVSNMPSSKIDFGTWQTYTPLLGQAESGSKTNITKTTHFAKYFRLGSMVMCNVSLTCGGSGTVGDLITVTLPFPANTNSVCGSFLANDVSSDATKYVGAVVSHGPNRVKFAHTFYPSNVSGILYYGERPSHSIGIGDTLIFTVTYEAE